jgi:GWxTD domain-containing protein
MKKNNSVPPAGSRKREWKKASLPGGIVMLLLLANCSGIIGSSRSLPPQDREFLSEVRYLISKKEIKLFKRTPPEERRKFIEEFWAVRDPDPTTVENEFRDEYYRRIDEANHLFHEGSAGWLSDRGRILILLGEPDRRDVYPTGYSFYEPPVEIWFYGMFPVIFIDYEREGIYRLDPTSARRISMINITQMKLKPKGIERNVREFDFVISLQEQGPEAPRLVLAVPYRVTSLVLNEKTKAYETQLKLTVGVKDSGGRTVLEKEESRQVTVNEAMLEGLGKDIILGFPLSLPPGRYTAEVLLENTADHTQARKMIPFKLQSNKEK